MGISVLMSVYAAELPDRLDRALKSVWDDQTLKPDEIILVEDGPLGQELTTVIERWRNRLKDSFIVLQNKENLGLTKSLNKGLDHVHHELIARMDSDDISHPCRFEKQVAYFENHPEVDVLGGFVQEFNDDGVLLNIRHYPIEPKEVNQYIAKASPVAHPTVMMRREIFDAGIRYDEDFRTSQDLALWFTLLDKGYKIANIADVILYFRLTDDVFKRRSKAGAVRELKIYTHGIRMLYGLFSWRYVYPIARFLFRMMPLKVANRIYNSSLRLKL